MADLDRDGQATLTRLGVRFGRLHLYLADQLKPAAVEARARLWRIWAEPGLALPVPGRTVLRGAAAAISPAAARALGFAPLAGLAIRVDVLERLAAGLRAKARDPQGFALPVELAAAAGLGRNELALVVEALGYRPEAVGEFLVYRVASLRHRPRVLPPPSVQVEARPAREPSPFAALAVLKAGR